MIPARRYRLDPGGAWHVWQPHDGSGRIGGLHCRATSEGKMKQIASHMLKALLEDITLEDGKFSVSGSPSEIGDL